jgi:hypothetical protein
MKIESLARDFTTNIRKVIAGTALSAGPEGSQTAQIVAGMIVTLLLTEASIVIAMLSDVPSEFEGNLNTSHSWLDRECRRSFKQNAEEINSEPRINFEYE